MLLFPGSKLELLPITLNPHITELLLRHTAVSTLDTGSLQFYEALTQLDLAHNRIHTVLPGAFHNQVRST